MCACARVAKSISRSTWTELLECAEKTSTITRQRSMARLISPGKNWPGRTSRGAIQQDIPASSSAVHTMSAVALSSDE